MSTDSREMSYCRKIRHIWHKLHLILQCQKQTTTTYATLAFPPLPSIAALAEPE